MSHFTDRPQPLEVALDVDPKTLGALTKNGIGPDSSVTFTVPGRRDG